jgi:predicted DsbA family dithiol-disulfide isomerase
MRPSGWLFLAQLCICAALGASAALYVHYLSPLDSGFCGPTSGCEAARRSALAYFGNPATPAISLPLFAMLAFAALLGLSVRRRPALAGSGGGLAGLWREPSLTLFAASGLGGAVALGLIGYQALVLGEFCWLCLIVDIATLLCAVFSFAYASAVRRTGDAGPSPLYAASWAVIAGLLVGGTFAWDAVRPPPPVPSAIAALYQPGKINIVEFSDFECPFCRRLHARLGPLLAEYGDRVHFVRKHRPLWRHPHAARAARAAVCAEAQGKGESMANRLFEVTLSHEEIDRLGVELQLDTAAYARCLEAEETTAALERDEALLPDGQLKGLPTTYVGGKEFLGVPSEAALRDAMDKAQRPPPVTLSGTVYSGALIALLAVASVVGRRRGQKAGR